MTFEQRNQVLKLKDKPLNMSLVGKILNKIDLFGWSKDWTRLLPFGWRMRYYDKIRPIWKDQNKRIRNSIPRTWCDISHMMELVNFEMIKKFYEKEYKADIVDWEATDHHKEFAEWLEWAYNYITKERLNYEKARDAAYPPFRPIDEWFGLVQEDANGRRYYEYKPREEPYELLYSEVNRLEQLIEDTDTKVLTEFVKYRGFFWT
jgi:hypothetical protein